MESSRKISLKNKDVFLIVILVIYALAQIITPRAYDDYRWGGTIGVERLLSLYKGYNGRFLNNTLAVITCHSKIIEIIFKTVVVYLMYKITNYIVKAKEYTILLIAMLFLLPSPAFFESFMWTSGFTGYGVALFIIILYCGIYKKYSEERKITAIELVSAFLVGVLSQLVLEHVAVFCMFVSAYIVITYFARTKKLNIYALVMLAGNIIGMFLLFNNGQDEYKQIETFSLDSEMMATFWERYTNHNYYLWFAGNVGMVILLLTAAVLFVRKVDIKSKKAVSILVYILTGVMALDTIYIMTINTSNHYVLGPVAIIIYALTLGTAICMSRISLEKKLKLLMPLLGQALLRGPLLLAFPVNARCYSATYLLFVIFAIELLEEVDFFEEILDATRKNKAMLLARLVIAAMMIFYVGSNIALSVFLNMEIKYVRAKAEQGITEIDIPSMPLISLFSENLSLLIMGEPLNEHYNIDPTTTYYEIPLDTWYESYENMFNE